VAAFDHGLWCYFFWTAQGQGTRSGRTGLFSRVRPG
jgi:hypothetical protein